MFRAPALLCDTYCAVQSAQRHSVARKLRRNSERGIGPVRNHIPPPRCWGSCDHFLVLMRKPARKPGSNLASVSPGSNSAAVSPGSNSALVSPGSREQCFHFTGSHRYSADGAWPEMDSMTLPPRCPMHCCLCFLGQTPGHSLVSDKPLWKMDGCVLMKTHILCDREPSC